MTSGEITLTREQLYDFVWKEPVRAVAARYGLSDRGLAKICVRLHVPLPGRGYWAQKAVGREPPRPRLSTLPPTAPPQESQINLELDPSRVALCATDSPAARQRVLEAAPENVIQVPPEL